MNSEFAELEKMRDWMMVPENYKKARKKVGTQQYASVNVGVDIRTIQRRECGDIPITAEAAIAMVGLVIDHSKEKN